MRELLLDSRRRQLDPQLAVAGAAILSLLLLVSGHPPMPLRVALGLPLTLVFPGYALMSALAPASLGRAERAVLSVGLSLAVAAVGGVVLDRTPWGLERGSWSAFLATLTVLGCATAAVRGRLAPAATEPRFLIAAREHVRAPLYRSGYALMLNQVAAGGLGVIYWIVAARLYPASVVGRNAALIATLILMAALSQLSLKQALTRFVPRSGKGTGRLIGLSYAVTLAVATVAGAIFVAIASLIGQHDLAGSAPLAGWLVVSIVCWAIFDMQDGVLTGMRRAGLVLTENGIYNVAKILLLIPLSHISPSYGVLLSWTLPVPLLVLAVNGLIFSRLIPRHLTSFHSRASAPSPRTIVRSVGADYAGSMLAEAGVRLLPLLVIVKLGDAANAYFYQAWLIATTFSLVAGSMGGSFTVEAAADPAALQALSRRTLVHLMRLLLPAAALVFVAAPWLLRIFGHVYADQGTSLLRWLIAGTLPMIVTTWFLSYARVTNRFRLMVTLPGLGAAITLALTYLLLPSYGISGAGIAWFAGQVAVAIVATVKGLPLLRAGSDAAVAVAQEEESGDLLFMPRRGRRSVARWELHVSLIEAIDGWLAAGGLLSRHLALQPSEAVPGRFLVRALEDVAEAAEKVEEIAAQIKLTGEPAVQGAVDRVRRISAELAAAQIDLTLHGRTRSETLAPLLEDQARALDAFAEASRRELGLPLLDRGLILRVAG